MNNTSETNPTKRNADDEIYVHFCSTLTEQNWSAIDVTITLDASAISWIAKLAQTGLEARIKAYRELPADKRDVSEAMSIGSFKSDLDALAEAVKAGKAKKRSKKHKSK